MKIIHLLIVSATILSASTEPTKRVPGYPNRLVTGGFKRPIPFGLAGRRTLVLQIRSDGPVPIVLKRPNRQQQMLSSHVRPVKFSVSPHFVFKSSPLGKQPRKPTAMMKFKYTKPKPHAGYSYEKPFSPAPELNKPQVDNSAHLTNTHFGPIHTVPAPNLGIQTNLLHPYEQPILTPRPTAQHQHLHQQYQVTEEHTNDKTIVDPISGHQTYFAPDPDPSLPAPRVPIAIDPYSTPSNGQPLPMDVQTNLLSSTSSGAQAPQFVQFINPASQQQYANTYEIQPQLQQYILQQTESAQQMPLAVYNPTYLVTQSNNLYNQHQQQLFNPNPNYLVSLKHNYPGVDLTQEVASEGQILQAGKDAEEYNILYESGNRDSPTFAALIGNPTDYNSASNLVDQHAVHPEQQQASAPGYVDSTALQSGFVVSNYYGNHHQPTSHQGQIDLSQAQHGNNLQLQQAQYDLQQQQSFGANSQQYSDQGSDQSATAAFEEHQRLLHHHLGGSALRIFVPDEEYQSENGLQKRSDDYSEEEKEEEHHTPDTTVKSKRD